MIFNPLLTIIIPTYNRVDCLSLLLNTLTDDLRGLENKVMVIVGDNASTDITPTVTNAFLSDNHSAKILRHSENIGAEENFCKCIDNVQSKFFWIIGDDDLPKKGVLKKIVYLLESENPDILYLNSEWTSHIVSADDGENVLKLTTKFISREIFAKKVNVWVTFISGMIVNLERLDELNPNLNMRRFVGTSLVQLGWILPLLMTGSRFQIVHQRCILATGGNTGGYKLLTVFAKNFPDIISKVCGDNIEVRNNIERALVWCYIPGLLWSLRFRNTTAFADENMMESLSSLRGKLGYWIMLLPLAKLHKLLAMPFYFVSKILAR